MPKGQEKFFFASLFSSWLFFKIDKTTLETFIKEDLDELGYSLATFDDPAYGYAVISPMFYTAIFGRQTTEKNSAGMELISEVEFNILVYPKSKSKMVPTLSFKDFILGHESQKIIGQLRLAVICNSLPAVQGGRAKYGEHKFLGDLNYNIDVFNNNEQAPHPISFSVSVYQWQGAGKPDQKLFQLSFSIENPQSIMSDFSPLVLYSAIPPEKSPNVKRRPIGSYRNCLSNLFQVYFPSHNSIQMSIEYGNCKNAPSLVINDYLLEDSKSWPQKMRELMANLLTDSTLSAVVLFNSFPAVTEPRPYYVD